MVDLVIHNGRLITPDGVISDGVVHISAGKITAAGPAARYPIPPEAAAIAAQGRWIAPGLIDGQTHGGAGFDYMEAAPEEIARVLRWAASNGVTGLLPTLATAGREDLLAMIRNLVSVQNQRPDGAAILGLHIEGPYISQGKRGAQPAQAIRQPDIDEMKELIDASGGSIRIVTLAPELPGALELIAFLSREGIVPSLGHSEAGYDQVIAAADAGLRRATHLFNGMTGFNHREPGAVGAVLVRDDIYAELILDGVHVHPAAAQVALRAKGPERIVLVTDSTQAAGLGDGVYIRPGNRKVIVENGVARLESGSLAGSVLTLNRAVANAMQFMKLDLPEALALASKVAAESIGFGETKGSLQAGKDADVIIVEDDLTVHTTVVDGRVVYQREVQ